MFLLAMFAYILRRENIATPSGYIFLFVDEVFTKCYTNISVITKSKSIVDTFFTHISP